MQIKIPHYSYLRYSNLEGGSSCDPEELHAISLVRAVRGLKLLRPISFRFRGRTVSFAENDMARVKFLILRQLASEVGKRSWEFWRQANISVVPIPNASMMSKRETEPHAILDTAKIFVDEFNRHPQNQGVKMHLTPALFWTQPSRLHGYHFELLHSPRYPVLLFDDFLWTGRSGKASAKFLSNKGFHVSGILTLGKETILQDTYTRPIGLERSYLSFHHPNDKYNEIINLSTKKKIIHRCCSIEYKVDELIIGKFGLKARRGDILCPNCSACDFDVVRQDISGVSKEQELREKIAGSGGQPTLKTCLHCKGMGCANCGGSGFQ